ncbi:MAG TPA: hypothetical protein VF720_02345, partial [Candidatus Eisenbacteria bacterium]
CLSVAMPADVRVEFDSCFLTPDGRTVVVLGKPRNPDGTVSAASRVYVRTLDGYDYKELPGTEGALYSVPSPDGRSLYFLAPSAPGSTQLRVSRLPIDGSAPPTTICQWKDSWRWMAPQESGDLLLGESPTSFIRLPGNGGAPSAPVAIDCGRPGVSRYDPPGGFLPDGRHMFINVVLYDARGWHYSLGVMNLVDGKVRILDEDGGNGFYLPSSGHLVFSRGNTILGVPFDAEGLTMRGAPTAVWSGLASYATYVPATFDLTPDGDLFYRPGQLGGDRPIVLVDAAGHATPWSSGPRPMNFAPIPSRDGSRIATQFISARGIDEIWVSSAGRDDFHRVGTEPGADAYFPVWSPDQRQIAYRRNGSDDKDGLYIIGVDGGEMTRILPEPAGTDYYDPNSWLPDGSGILLTRLVQGKSSIWLLPKDGGQWGSPRSILGGEFRNELPMISPDGRALAFQNDESGKLQSYVVAFRGQGVVGRAIAIRTEGSRWHQWGNDGTTLYVHDERNRLMKVTFTTTSELSVSAPQEVCDLDKQHGNSIMWTVLPDGRFFVGLKNAHEEDATSANLVLGWSRVLAGGAGKTDRNH